MLRFRSDKAYMTAKEMEERQRKAQELQDALDQQIQEKKRKKVGKPTAAGALLKVVAQKKADTPPLWAKVRFLGS
jgi:hypothetical protein